MTGEQSTTPRPPTTTRVQLRLTPAELCDVDLLAAGYLAGLEAPMGVAEVENAGSESSPWPVPIALRVPVERTDITALEQADEVALLDPEGVELATVTTPTVEHTSAGPAVLTGALNVRQRAQHGAAAHLYVGADDVRRVTAGTARSLALVVTGPPTRASEKALAEAAADGPVTVFLAAESTSLSDRELAAARAWELVARSDDKVLVVVLPVGPLTDEPSRRLLGVVAAASCGCAEVGVAETAIYDGSYPLHRELCALAERHGMRIRPLHVPSLDTTPLLHAGAHDGLRPDFGEEAWAEVRRGYPPRNEQGLTLFFTGLSGAGKSTIARAVADRLSLDTSRRVSLLDGDVVRHHLSSGLGFSRADRETNVRRIGWVASEITRHGGLAICAPIAPYAQLRADVRRMVSQHGGFILVHIATPIEECERRDRKGLYAQARRGAIPEFTGISDPYEVPDEAEVRIDTTGRSVQEAVDTVVDYVRRAGYLT